MGFAETNIALPIAEKTIAAGKETAHLLASSLDEIGEPAPVDVSKLVCRGQSSADKPTSSSRPTPRAAYVPPCLPRVP